MPREKKDNSNNEEGFKEGGWFSKIKKKVVGTVTNTFMKPINNLKDRILKPIITIEDFIRAVLCFALYLQLIFLWFSKTFTVLAKYFFASPFCFMFWILDSFMRFIQYIIIDIILNLVLQPAVYIGKALNYPFIGDIRISDKNKKSLYVNTNVVRGAINFVDDQLNLPFKIYDKCFNIGIIDSFPTYHS
jgi:hypothetical protein